MQTSRPQLKKLKLVYYWNLSSNNPISLSEYEIIEGKYDPNLGGRMSCEMEERRGSLDGDGGRNETHYLVKVREIEN